MSIFREAEENKENKQVILSTKKEFGKVWIAMHCAKIGHGGSDRKDGNDSVIGISETEQGIVRLVRKSLDSKPKYFKVNKKNSPLRWIIDPDNGEWWILVFLVEFDKLIELNMLAAH